MAIRPEPSPIKPPISPDEMSFDFRVAIYINGIQIEETLSDFLIGYGDSYNPKSAGFLHWVSVRQCWTSSSLPIHVTRRLTLYDLDESTISSKYKFSSENSLSLINEYTIEIPAYPAISNTDIQKVNIYIESINPPLSLSFKHHFRNTSLIGTGTYKFRPYTVAEPMITGNFLTTSSDEILQDNNGNNLEYITQLSTPQNVTADGTTVIWDAVENATSYKIFADDVIIGTL